jgi:two-component system response regulator DesR
MIIGEVDLMRGALAAMLAGQPGMRIAAEIRPDDDVAAAAGRHRPDVVLIDLDGSPAAALGAARQLAGRAGCPVLMLTGRQNPGPIRDALAAQVRGFVDKDVAPDQFARAIRRVAAGEGVIAPALAAVVLGSGGNPLTPREREVLLAAAEGLRSSEIARRLHLAPGTVRNYLSTAISKTGTRNRLEAVRRAQEAGWLGD